MNKYVVNIDTHEVVPSNWVMERTSPPFAEWARVALDEVPGVGRVSTVFLGSDHRHFGAGPPILYESMAFLAERDGDNDCERYSTWSEAEEGHKRMVAKWLTEGGAA